MNFGLFGTKAELSVIYKYNAKFWRAPIGRNRSRDAIVSLLSGRLSAHSARFWQFSLKI